MENNINVPQLGMSMVHPSMMKENQFSLLLNGRVQSVNGNWAIITNDSSNILGTKFKEGFKVIGTNIVPTLSVTFFFLCNPSTGESEIGFIYDATSPDKPDSVAENGNIVESTPLEQTTQHPISIYHTFVNANCLNFDIDHPVQSWIKIDDCNVRIYFNDFKNPPRFIDYKDFQKINLSNCPLIETDQLDCDKIKIFPETCYPTIEVTDVVSGGQNLAGVYQFAVAYADVNSNKITDYFYVSNPIPLFDQPIIPNNNTAYPVYKSFKLLVEHLNTDFKYINIVVLKTINNQTSVQLIETFEVFSDTFEYVYTGVDKNLQQDLSLDDILVKRPIYSKAKGLSESNGYLFQFNLDEDRILNLQPVVIDIPVKWITLEMNDGDYENSIISQNFVGYLGDEVYPFGIAFTKTNGKQTNVFPFVNRIATSFDLEDVSLLNGQLNPDVINNSSCDTTQNSLRWQVYNTASVIDSVTGCIDQPSPTDQLVEITDEVECFSEEVLINSVSGTNPDGTFIYTTTPVFYNYPANTTNPNNPNYIPYPPQNSSDAEQVQNYLNQGTLNINQFYNENICDCNVIAQDYPNVINISQSPLDIDPASTSTSIEVITEEQSFSINSYSSTALEAPEISTYPYEPSPCKNFGGTSDADEKDQERGYIGWVQSKTNSTAQSSESITQSSNSQCGIETWGSYITDPENSPSESWYLVTCTNQDGVMGILFSTGNNSATLTLYEKLSNGNPGTQINPTAPQQNGYYLFENLDLNRDYLIKIALPSGISYPPEPAYSCGKNCCSPLIFKLCVISPPVESSTQIIIPGVAKVVKKCIITYQGVPENTCKPKPDKYGDFAYWESTETYPCNEEVWKDLAGKPIRHFKFPDHSVIPFFKESGATINKLSLKNNKIYPKGIRVDINDIKLALEKAVANQLITEQEKSEICGYRIYRGNRRGNQSIIAKGLLYDIWEYKDNIYNTGNKVMFPNFPFNDNRDNNFITTTQVKNLNSAVNNGISLKHPFNSAEYKNNKYTFDAPNLSFNNPGLGTEIKLECEQVGKASGSFIELKNNAKYQYIGAGIISAAIGFASVEAAFEALNVMVNATLSLPITVFGSGTAIPLGLILALVGENIISPVRMYSHYGEWYELIKKFAPYRNYGVFYTSVGKYVGNDSVPQGNIRRTLANSQYIKPGVLNVRTTKGSLRFNNFKRDSSVFLELDNRSIPQGSTAPTNYNYFYPTVNIDDSRQTPDCNFNAINTNIASYYGSLKNTLVNQYGQIDNIEWIDTGYNGKIDWENPYQSTLCDPIFGGDTYITRFTKKRKTPLFLEDRVVPNNSTTVGLINNDIQMSLLPNIGYPRYFMNYPTTLDYTGATQALFGDVAVLSKTRADYNFLCFSSDGQSWKDAGLAAAILGSFAGVSFGVASLPIAVGIISGKTKNDLGNDLFLKGKYVHSFYGISSFLCESDYNLEYRYGTDIQEGDFYPNVGDTNEWTQEYFVPISEDNTFNYNNDYSKQNKENPNFVLNNDFKQEKEDCKVSHPNRLIYSLQDNDQSDNFDGNRIYLANNRYDFPKSYGKLQIVKGIDNNKILAILENGYTVQNVFNTLEGDVRNIAVGSGSLFSDRLQLYVKTDLGFAGSQTPAISVTEFGAFWVDNKRGQIIQYQDQISNIIKPEEEWWFKENLPFHILEDFPDFDITNNFKYLGMSITYDARFKRVIFTKRDVELKPQYKNYVTYDGMLFHFDNEVFTVENDKYFCNKSWTISYYPLLKSFVSWHSFLPNYYIGNQNYFSSGTNYPINGFQEGSVLYHHNLTNQSYQVYDGNLYPFIWEYSIPTKFQNKMLESIKYTSEFYRFQDNLSSGLVPELTYNKAILYNQKQSSGLLELVVKEKNNRRQSILYPIQNQNSRSILVEKVNNEWSFNNFHNVATYNTQQPLFQYDCNNIAYKELNTLSINYKPQYLKEKLVSDYHVIRLINDKYSNYQIINRWNITQTNNYNS